MPSLNSLLPRLQQQALPALGVLVALVPAIALLIGSPAGSSIGTETQPTVEGPTFTGTVVNELGVAQRCSYDASWVPEERVHRTDAQGRFVTPVVAGDHTLTLHCGLVSKSFAVHMDNDDTAQTFTVGLS